MEKGRGGTEGDRAGAEARLLKSETTVIPLYSGHSVFV